MGEIDRQKNRDIRTALDFERESRQKYRQIQALIEILDWNEERESWVVYEFQKEIEKALGKCKCYRETDRQDQRNNQEEYTIKLLESLPKNKQITQNQQHHFQKPQKTFEFCQETLNKHITMEIEENITQQAINIQHSYLVEEQQLQQWGQLEEKAGRRNNLDNEGQQYYSERIWQSLFPQQCRVAILKLDLSRQQWNQGEFNSFCCSLGSIISITSIDLDLSHNFIEDNGSMLLSSSLSKLSKLTQISLDLQRNNLQRNAFAVLLTLNYLSDMTKISLDLRGNSLELETELSTLLPKFNNEKIFSKLTSFTLSIDEVKAAPENNILPPQNTHLIDKIRCYSQQLQSLIQSARQLSHSESDLQIYEQRFSQLNMQIANAKSQLQKNELIQNKKSGACRILEIMLKFTVNLETFAFSFPGQLIGSREWEFLGGLLRNRNQNLKQIKLQGMNANYQCPEMGYALYQIGKLTNLTSLSLSLHNLSANSGLGLNRFLMNLPMLQSLNLDFSSMDDLAPQAEIFNEIAQLITSTQNLTSLSLSLAHSLIGDESAFNIFTCITSLKHLSSISVSLKECKNITPQALISFSNSLIACKSIHTLSLDLAGAIIAPASIVSFLERLAISKSQTLISFVFNFLSLSSRRQQFSAIQSNQINIALSSLICLKKCIVTLPNNQFLNVIKERANKRNQLIKACHLAKQSKIFEVIRKDFAFQVLDFLF